MIMLSGKRVMKQKQQNNRSEKSSIFFRGKQLGSR